MGMFDNVFSRQTVNRATLPMRSAGASLGAGLVTDTIGGIVTGGTNLIRDAMGLPPMERQRGGAFGVQPRMHSADEINAQIARPGSHGRRGNANAGPSEQSFQTAEQIARDVRSGKLDGHEAQKMINEGKVILPNPKTIATQAPAPVEDISFRANTEPVSVSATPAAVAESFPVKSPGKIEVTTLSEAPTRAEELKGMAKEEFAAVASNPPSKSPKLDAVVEAPKAEGRFDADTYKRARDYVAANSGPSGMA